MTGHYAPRRKSDLLSGRASAGATLTSEADESTTGPASLTLTDPDGNTILLDQHVG